MNLRRAHRHNPRKVLPLIWVLFFAACSAPTKTPEPAALPPTQIVAPASATHTSVSTTATDTPTPLATPALEITASATITPPTPPSAVGLPDAASLSWHEVASGLDNPTSLAAAGDGSGRLFIVEQAGTIRTVSAEGISTSPFLDLRDRVGSRGFEQGLLGLAFHPRFVENGFLFVNYTDLSGNTVISRFAAQLPPSASIDPASEHILLRVQQPYPNHNGGMLAFGPDGYLYIGLGDGGSANDPQGNGQSLSTLLGKILRIDVDNGETYAIPADNPHANGGGLAEIWAYGLRNPWRFSFDRLTGDLYLADVGQNTWEEVNFLPAGAPGGGNFGWNYREGAHPFAGQPAAGLQLIDPVAEYDHSQGCSITGGVVYRGLNLPQLQGVYLYADFCSGTIWGLLKTPTGWQNEVLFRDAGNITTFGEDDAGEVYFVSRAGTIYQLRQR